MDTGCGNLRGRIGQMGCGFNTRYPDQLVRELNERALEAVDDIQSNAKMFEEETRNTLLRLACESISEPSKMFAQYLGMATATDSSPLHKSLSLAQRRSQTQQPFSREQWQT